MYFTKKIAYLQMITSKSVQDWKTMICLLFVLIYVIVYPYILHILQILLDNSSSKWKKKIILILINYYFYLQEKTK